MGDTFVYENGKDSGGRRAKPGMRWQHDQVPSPCPRQNSPLSVHGVRRLGFCRGIADLLLCGEKLDGSFPIRSRRCCCAPPGPARLPIQDHLCPCVSIFLCHPCPLIEQAPGEMVPRDGWGKVGSSTVEWVKAQTSGPTSFRSSPLSSP